MFDYDALYDPIKPEQINGKWMITLLAVCQYLHIYTFEAGRWLNDIPDHVYTTMKGIIYVDEEAIEYLLNKNLEKIQLCAKKLRNNIKM